MEKIKEFIIGISSVAYEPQKIPNITPGASYLRISLKCTLEINRTQMACGTDQTYNMLP